MVGFDSHQVFADAASRARSNRRCGAGVTRALARVWLLAIAPLLVACLPDDALRLVDAANGKALAQTEVEIFIDDGVRCVTTPCPTGARSWRGQTDAQGELRLPDAKPDETRQLRVAGFTPVMIERGGAELRLKRIEPRKPAQVLSLRARFTSGGDALEVEVSNPGPRPLTLVHPRGDRLARYAEWGGWHVLVKHARGMYFLPEPLPGPYIAASNADLVTLAVGQTLTQRIDIGHWRATSATPQAAGSFVREIEGKLTARVRWSKLPQHLRADAVAPRAIASARYRRAQ